MILAFMGLYGVASPLPNYISELIATQEEETLPLQAFLDIFNHRFYSLFYRSWKKYRYYLQFESEGKDRFSQYMLSLLGLGTRVLSDKIGVPPTRLIAYSGIIGHRVHCAEGLRRLISDYFGGIEVNILEFMPRWVAIPEQISLGIRNSEFRSARLGENVVIGKKILDCSSKFRVALGPLSLKEYLRFLPDGVDTQALYRLIRFYATEQLDFDVELRLKTKEVPPLQLGSELAQLGRTIWLGEPQGDVVSVVVAPKL
jgi:type VI secretion system protein ImpH